MLYDSTYKVTIQGVSPLLMNHFQDASFGDKSKTRTVGNKNPQDMANEKLYLNSEGLLYTPATHLQGCLVEAGKNLKVVGKGKSTYSKIAGYACEVNPFEIIHKKQDWDIFSVTAVNPSTKGRMLVHRPKLNEWELDFEVNFDSDEIPQEIMKQLFDIGGRIVGIGDWRPAKKGRFGKFQVIDWSVK